MLDRSPSKKFGDKNRLRFIKNYNVGYRDSIYAKNHIIYVKNERCSKQIFIIIIL